MIDVRGLGTALLGALLLGGCCCPPDGPPTRCDPLRAVGVDSRGIGDPTVIPSTDVRQVFLDLTIVRVPEARVAAALGARRPRHAGEPTTLSTQEARALLSAWRADPLVEITSAPKLLALPGQEASIFVGETVRFAKTAATTTGVVVVGSTLDSETIRYARTQAASSQDGGLTFSIEEDPFGPVDLGMQIVVVANPSEAGGRIAVDLAGSWRELKQPLSPEATAEMTAAEFETHVREHRLDTRFELPRDGWVLVGNPEWIETDAGRVAQVTLLHATWIEKDETAARQ